MIGPRPSDRLERVKELLEQALELDPGDRDSFLAEACGGEDDLREEVESLLAQESAEAAWPEAPILPQAPPKPEAPPLLQPGQRVGPYRVVEVLGQGGMGTVALAVREDQFEKKVALKVIRPEQLAPDLQRRFENEQQILAQLEHPSIARILDAGKLGGEETTAGHFFGFPYFVMELVEGEPIDRFCESRQLSVDQRLELFLEVCSAVSYAHRNLVIHRDLKPGNILVTTSGRPKLLDFGIAKRLDPGSDDLTRAGERPMTVRYASPEQLEGKPVTTASDIYALGLLLFRLLTGEYPYEVEGESDVQLAFAIGREQPRPASTMADTPDRARALRGDLDSILLKTLAKDPEQRYATVDQLAEDLRRHREGRPVSTRAGNWSYRTSRLLRRHWLAVATVTAVVTMSVAFALVSWTLQIRAEQAQIDAETARGESDVSARRAREMTAFIKGIFRYAPELDAEEKERRNRVILGLLQEGENRLDELGTEDPLLQPEMLLTFGEIYRKLGELDLARGSFKHAEGLLRNQDREALPLLAKIINNLATLEKNAGEYAVAEQLYRESLTIKKQFPIDMADIDYSKAYANLSTSLIEQGKLIEAAPFLEEALRLRLESHDRRSKLVASSLRSLGVLHYELDRLQEAEPLLREALEIRRELYEPGSTNVASARVSMARLLRAQKRLGEAEALLQLALEVRQDEHGENHFHTAINHLDLAHVYLDLGSPERAEPHLDRAWQYITLHRAEDSPEVALAKGIRGAYLTQVGHLDEAESLLRESHQWFRAIYTTHNIYWRLTEEWLEELHRAREPQR